MVATKKKWTLEEEAALKSGVLSYGKGKWRKILKDPKFSGVLYLCSNVHLKDKWRSMTVMASSLGSQYKTRLALKRMFQSPVQNDSSESDEEIPEARPATTSSGS